jgi:D-xylose transport system substrate-binding protein
MPRGLAAEKRREAGGQVDLRFVPALAVTLLIVTACGAGSSGVTAGKKIALLLPGTGARYEDQDRPAFADKLRRICADCQVLYSAAKQGAEQEAQAKTAITDGASVIVLDPIDTASAAAIVADAKAANIPVISYDRMVANTAGLNYYVGFDNAGVGGLQAKALLTAIGTKTNPKIIELNLDPNDKEAMVLKTGAHSVLDGKVQFLKEYSTPGSRQADAQTDMENALKGIGGAKLDGVLAGNDALAAGAIAAMKSGNLRPLPPVTGQGAALTAIQRIVAGEQYMTVYQSVRLEAETAAQLAYDLTFGIPVPASMTGGITVNNGTADVPSALVTPTSVTKVNIESTVVADGFWSADQICTTQYISACAVEGIS